MSAQNQKPNIYFISKGKSNFCSELVYDVDTDTMHKANPDGFYDIVALEDTVEGGVKVIEYSAFQKAVEALKFLASSDAYFVEPSDDETGYFDPYKGPQHFAKETLRELGVGDE